jgi:hypothetical protein
VPIGAIRKEQYLTSFQWRLKISSMTKTQIQVPEELFREVRAFSKKREWSLAETFRRGAELLLQVYPDTTAATDAVWTPPTSSRVGWKGLSAEQLRDTTFTESDPRLA